MGRSLFPVTELADRRSSGLAWLSSIQARERPRKDEAANTPLGHMRAVGLLLEGRIDAVRLRNAFHIATATLTAAALLSACSSGTQTNSAPLPPTTVLGNQARAAAPNARTVRLDGVNRTFYISQHSQNNALAFQYSHRTFTGGSAVSGAPGGYALWIDREKNLYVGNYTPGAGKIFEYNALRDFVFTYDVPSLGGTVQAVTTDQYGNVFEADGDNSVREFPSNVNAPIATCAPPGAALGLWGVAVDKQGDVFVDYASSSDSGNLIEYPHGLVASGCNGMQIFGVDPFPTAGGIALDPQKNLVICDPGGSTVWILSPPYTESATLATLGSGFTNPVNVTITKKGSQALVTDLATGANLLTYPGGTRIAAIGAPYAPTAAVDTANYVP